MLLRGPCGQQTNLQTCLSFFDTFGHVLAYLSKYEISLPDLKVQEEILETFQLLDANITSNKEQRSTLKKLKHQLLDEDLRLSFLVKYVRPRVWKKKYMFAKMLVGRGCPKLRLDKTAPMKHSL